MKKSIISIIILLILVIPSKIFAQTVYTGEVTSTGGWIRTAPNTSLELPDLGQAPKGAKYTLVTNELIPDESTRTDRKCPEGWYKFYFNETTIGYFCSTGMKVTSTEIPDAQAPVDTPTSSECENEMKNAGFPSNYWSKLCADVVDKCLSGDVANSVKYIRENYIKKYGEHPVTRYNAIRSKIHGTSYEQNEKEVDEIYNRLGIKLNPNKNQSSGWRWN